MNFQGRNCFLEKRSARPHAADDRNPVFPGLLHQRQLSRHCINRINDIRAAGGRAFDRGGSDPGSAGVLTGLL